MYLYLASMAFLENSQMDFIGCSFSYFLHHVDRSVQVANI